MRALTEQQWWAKARRHEEWDACRRAEMAALEETIESLNDILALREIIGRAGPLEKRIARLKRIMARHLERALFPGFDRAPTLGGPSP